MIFGEEDTLDGGKSPDKIAYAWVMRFASGKASEVDLAALRRWLARSPEHRDAFDRISRSWEALKTVAAEGEGAPLGLTGVPDRLVRAKPNMTRRLLVGGGALAASAAVLAIRPPLGLWPSLTELSADFRTDIGEQRHLVLADKTSIEMNTRTGIALRPEGAGPPTVELISGEAMITTPPGAETPLTVLVGDGRIVATAAHFNVRDLDREVCVTCLSGAVQIVRGRDVRPLPAGHQISYSKAGIGLAIGIDAAVVTAWHDGFIVFQSTPVTDVVTEINRYRAGLIVVTNSTLGRRLFNARLRIADVDHVVGQIERTFSAKALTLPGGIVLLG